MALTGKEIDIKARDNGGGAGKGLDCGLHFLGLFSWGISDFEVWMLDEKKKT